MNSQTIISRNDERFLASELGEDLVIMDLEQGDFIGLNSIGADIWKLLDSPITSADLVKKMIDLYEVDKNECESDIQEFLQKMISRNAIQLK